MTVEQLPIDTNIVLRKGLEMLSKYLEQSTPKFEEGVTRSEMALFDQIVAIRMSQSFGPVTGQSTPKIEDAVKDAVHAITERRKLFLNGSIPAEKAPFNGIEGIPNRYYEEKTP